MKTFAKLFFYTNIFSFLFFCSCKERPCEEIPVKVDTAFVPDIYKEPLESYHGFDTLKFLTEKGDTVIFLGQGLNTGYNKVDNFAEDKCSTKSTIYKQFVGYTFYPLNKYPTELEYYVSRNLNTSNGLNFYILINNLTFFTYPDLPPLSSPIYIQNLDINGRKYNNVYKIYRNFDPKDKSFVYFSKVEGIIQFVFPNSETLSKI